MLRNKCNIMQKVLHDRKKCKTVIFSTLYTQIDSSFSPRVHTVKSATRCVISATRNVTNATQYVKTATQTYHVILSSTPKTMEEDTEGNI